MGSKKWYSNPMIELIVLQGEDVVRTSTGVYGDDNVETWDTETWG